MINIQKYLDKITKHIVVINDELGSVKSDIKWIKRIGYYLITLVTVMLVRSFI